MLEDVTCAACGSGLDEHALLVKVHAAGRGRAGRYMNYFHSARRLLEDVPAVELVYSSSGEPLRRGSDDQRQNEHQQRMRSLSGRVPYNTIGPSL